VPGIDGKEDVLTLFDKERFIASLKEQLGGVAA
jgi:hypothetical protein